MANIRINALPSDASPAQADVLPIDGSTTRKATIKQVAEIGRPAASQAEAETGTDPTKAMTPLTVKQSIAAEVGSTIASKSQGDKADSAMQPATYDPQAIGGDAFARANHTGTQSADTITDGTTNKNYTATEQTKLDGIEALADVTDATNVAAAGAVMSAATDASSFGFVLDDDDTLAAASATKLALSKNVKAYVDALGLPTIQTGDFGKQLSVKSTEDGYELLDPGCINANHFCRPDGVAIDVTATIASGTPNLTATGADFSADDVGKLITVPGAGATGANLGTTIAAVVSSTEVTLADNAGTALSAAATTIYYGTDNQDAITAALLASAGQEIFFPAGVYMLPETGSLTVYPGTSVRGVFGRTIFRRNAGSGVPGNIFLNAGFNDDAISDSDIVFDKIATDFTLRGDTDQLIGIYMRMAQRVKVLDCVQWYGGDLSALTSTLDTEVSGCIAYEMRNCGYDHWHSVGRVIVRGNIVVNETVTSRQLGVMVTATNTDPATGDTSTGSSNDIIITGNMVHGASGNDGNIVVNHLLETDTLSNVIIANNSVKGGGPNGIAIRGPANVIISGNQVDGTDGSGIAVSSAFSSNPATYPKNVNVTGNTLTNCGNAASSAITINNSAGGLVGGNVIGGGTYQYGIKLAANASAYQVSGNTIEDGLTGDILDQGSNNIVSTPKTADFYYRSTVVYDAASPTGAFQALDLSAVVGANRALVHLRVLNNSAAAENYIFRPSGMLTDKEYIASLPAGEARFITLTTNQNGVVDWFSGPVAADTEVRVEAFHRLQ